jgi:hypothetical protein
MAFQWKYPLLKTPRARIPLPRPLPHLRAYTYAPLNVLNYRLHIYNRLLTNSYLLLQEQYIIVPDLTIIKILNIKLSTPRYLTINNTTS